MANLEAAIRSAAEITPRYPGHLILLWVTSSSAGSPHWSNWVKISVLTEDASSSPAWAATTTVTHFNHPPVPAQAKASESVADLFPQRGWPIAQECALPLETSGGLLRQEGFNFGLCVLGFIGHRRALPTPFPVLALFPKEAAHNWTMWVRLPPGKPSTPTRLNPFLSLLKHDTHQHHFTNYRPLGYLRPPRLLLHPPSYG